MLKCLRGMSLESGTGDTTVIQDDGNGGAHDLMSGLRSGDHFTDRTTDNAYRVWCERLPAGRDFRPPRQLDTSFSSWIWSRRKGSYR